MSVLTAPSIPAQEERVLLEDVNWEKYEELLAANEDCQTPRMAYDHGRLEIMMTISMPHEDFNRTLDAVVELVAEEWELECKALGSTTCRRKDLQVGAEPDSCFYLKNAEQIRHLKKID